MLGEGIHVGENRVGRLMRIHDIEGIYRRRYKGCTRQDPRATPYEDLVMRGFTVDGPDRLWVGDITEHPTAEGKVYVATVISIASPGWIEPTAPPIRRCRGKKRKVRQKNGREPSHTTYGIALFR